MFLGILLGFAALGLVTAAYDGGPTETDDPVGPDGLRVSGTDNPDLLDGGAGNDRFLGEGGADLIIGNSGGDDLLGGDGNDSLHGGDGNDFLRGGGGDDVLIGNAGADTIRGDAGDDHIISAAILDEPAYLASLQNAEFASQVETPLAYGTDTDAGDEVDGGYGDDQLTFGTDDTVTGGEGDDWFEAGDWIVPGKPATITDFDPTEDVITYSFDGATPRVTVETDDDGTATVSADDKVFLVVRNAGPEFSERLIELIAR